MEQSYPIYACTRANHAVKWEKTWQVESAAHMEQHHIKFVEKLHI